MSLNDGLFAVIKRTFSEKILLVRCLSATERDRCERYSMRIRGHRFHSESRDDYAFLYSRSWTTAALSRGKTLDSCATRESRVLFCVSFVFVLMNF